MPGTVVSRRRSPSWRAWATPLQGGGSARSCLNRCECFAHCCSEGRAVIKIVMPCIDSSFENQIRDCRAQRCAAPCRNDGVPLCYDEGCRRGRLTNEVDGGHTMAEKQADRSPPIEIPSQGLQRVEGR